MLRLDHIWEEVRAFLPQDSIQHFLDHEKAGANLFEAEIDARFISGTMDIELDLRLPPSSSAYYKWHVVELRKAISIVLHREQYPVIQQRSFNCFGPMGMKHTFERASDVQYSPSFKVGQAAKHGYVYFMRNGDLYKIGITLNLIRRINELRPDELLDVVRCTNYLEIEKNLHSEYRSVRLPQSEYFRLDQKQIEEVHRFLATKALK